MLYNSKCLINCPITTYLSFGNCLNCDPTCLTCSILPINCLSCNSNFMLVNGQCISKCPIKTYYSAFTTSCETCSINCISCTSKSICNQCLTSTYIYNQTCYSSCPQGTYQSNSSCVKCFSNCL